MKYQTVGKVINTHGLKGEVKVKPNYFAMQLAIFVPEQIIYLMKDKDAGYIELKIKTVRQQQPFLLISFASHETIEMVQFMKNKILMANVESKSNNFKLENHQVNLTGYQAIDAKTSKLIGKVDSFIDNNHQGIWKIITINYQTLLVPNHITFIQEIDQAKRCVKINLIEGLVIDEKI